MINSLENKTHSAAVNLLELKLQIAVFFREIEISILDKNNKYLENVYDLGRRQYNAEILLDYLGHLGEIPSKNKKIYITSLDLFMSEADCIYGLSQRRGGNIAIVSSFRLKGRNERLIKEILHEAGHLYGLGHCGDKFCLMSLALDISDIDFRKKRFCKNCRKILEG
jgi:archaemetzincin